MLSTEPPPKQPDGGIEKRRTDRFPPGRAAGTSASMVQRPRRSYAFVSAFPRRELKRLRRRWLRRNLGIVAFLMAGFVLVAALTSVPLATSELPVRWYVIGLLQASLVAAALHLVNSAFLAHEATAIWQLRGAWG